MSAWPNFRVFGGGAMGLATTFHALRKGLVHSVAENEGGEP
jgi:hypothetical protein